MNFEHRWKLRDWVPIEKLHWDYLSKNPNAIFLLESHFDEINWYMLSSNTNPLAIPILHKNMNL